VIKYYLLIPFILFSTGQAFALPDCPEDQTQRYHNCFGTFTSANGDQYIGELKDDLPNGQGTHIHANGAQYAGDWKDGKYDGQGTYTYPDGSKYVGEFRDDKIHGQGTLTSADGRKYVGEFKGGLEHGQGTLTLADGGQYIGEFKDGKPNGQGTETLANGDQYVGEFRDGKRHGQGTKTLVSGNKYVGEWKDGLPNGQGTYTSASIEAPADPSIAESNSQTPPNAALDRVTTVPAVSTRDIIAERDRQAAAYLRLQNDLRLNAPISRRVFDVMGKTGFPSDYIYNNIDQLEADVRRDDFDAKGYWETSPITAKWASENPYRFAAIRKWKDLEEAKGYEWLVKSWSAAWEAGSSRVKTSELAAYERLQGEISAESEERIKLLKLTNRYYQQGYDVYEAESQLEKMWVETARILPMSAYGLESIVLGAGLATTAAVVAAALGTTAITAPLLIAAGSIGAMVWCITVTTRLETGDAYLYFEEGAPDSASGVLPDTSSTTISATESDPSISSESNITATERPSTTSGASGALSARVRESNSLIYARQRLKHELRYDRPRAIRVMEVQGQTGYPMDLVQNNLEDLEEQLRSDSFNSDERWKDSLITTRWAIKNPYRFAAIGEGKELRNAEGWEWMVKAWSAATSAGQKGIVDISEYAAKLRLDGRLDENSNDIIRLNQIEHRSALEGHSFYGAESAVQKAWVSAARILPMSAYGLESIVLGAGLATTAAVAAAALGTTAITAPLLIAAGSIGAMVWCITVTTRLETGGAYLYFRDFNS
jgi:hypothetical protein